MLSDIYMPDLGGLELVDALRAIDPNLPIVLMTAQGSVQVAVEAVSRGASDFIGKPFDISAVVDLLRRLLEARREADAIPAVRAGSAAQAGRPGGPKRAHDRGLQADRAGRAHRRHRADPGRIRHRQGTGGARHPRFQLAPRRAPSSASTAPASPTRCWRPNSSDTRAAPLPGATGERAGLFEAADGGTLFLDELASTSPAFQQSLLRVLQSGEVRRVGSTQSRRMNVRVIGASNAPLRDLVAAGSFRADLYYRLSVLSVELPPLRERAGDVELLTGHFLQVFREPGAPPLHLTREAAEALAAHTFPGNVRELENALRRAVALSSGGLVTIDCLPPEIGARRAKTAARRTSRTAPDRRPSEHGGTAAPLSAAYPGRDRLEPPPRGRRP